MTVLMEILNSQTVQGDTQEISDRVIGELFSGENEFSVSYADKNLGGQTVVTVCGADGVSVKRTGSLFDTEMVLKKGKRCAFVYKTPYGEIMLETDTSFISSLVEENGGFIELEYDLLQGGVKQSQNKMKISFSEEKNVKVSQKG